MRGLFAQLLNPGRLVRTVGNMRFSQIRHRLQRHVFRPTIPRLSRARLVVDRKWQPAPEKPAHLVEPDTLSIFGVRLALPRPESWQDASENRLWMYHLHYFDDLCSADGKRNPGPRLALLRRWIRENPPGIGTGWEPYPTSRRIVNWLKWGLCGGSLEDEAVHSLAVQAGWLSRTLERHLLGNHFIANLKALLFAGELIDSASTRRLVPATIASLERELDEQILADGAHSELSPMYHLVVLEDLLDIVNLLGDRHSALQERLRPVIRAMFDWLELVCHPDGQIAQLNDAAFNGCCSPGELLSYATRLGVDVPPANTERTGLAMPSGIARMVAGSVVAILDLGPVGPRHLPGHAHADNLTFELSVDGSRIVVDSGTMDYAPGPRRLEERSTAAHNTVEVNGVSSSEIWNAFRVGRRAHPGNVSLREKQGEGVATGSHDGYFREFGIVHGRTWTLTDRSLQIDDVLDGRGQHDVRWSMHFAPSVQCRIDNEHEFSLLHPRLENPIRLYCDASLSYVIEECGYCPNFGERIVTRRLVGTVRAELPLRIGVTMHFQPIGKRLA